METLARIVHKNKSSFYHHFADLDFFTDYLLEYHLNRTIEVAEKERNASKMEEIIDLFVLNKEDLLFNRQLRVHRHHPSFAKCLEQTTQIAIPSIMPIWAKTLALSEHSYLAQMVLQLSIENFYLQITEETLNHHWLNNYFQELKNMVTAFKTVRKT